MREEAFDWASFREFLFDAEIASPNSLRGCTKEEIISLENRYKVSFPGIYREFLREMGHAQGRWAGGDYWLYKDLDEIQELAHSMSEEYVALPQHFFAFCMDGPACQVLFFDCNEDAYDPPVYRYMENDETWKQVRPTFSAMLLHLANETAEYIKQFG